MRPAIEAVLTTWPGWRWAIIRGTNASMPWITPHRLTPITHSQSWWVADSSPPCTVTPALLHSTWTAPHCEKARSARACTSARRVTSVRALMASPPTPLTAATVPSMPASSTSATTMRAPARARHRHSARPIPLAPPVTTATRLFRLSIEVPSAARARRFDAGVWRRGREMSSVSPRAGWYPVVGVRSLDADTLLRRRTRACLDRTPRIRAGRDRRHHTTTVLDGKARNGGPPALGGRSSVTEYRLPTTVVPVRYDLRLEPDLAAATFAGEETIAVTVREPVTEVVLNAAELAIQSVAAEGADGVVLQGSAAMDAEAERARLLFPSTLTPGEWRLRILFTGVLNDRLHGFYRSTYKDAAGVSHTIAATQFESTDARRGFPCWDEPALKAVFGVTLVVPEGLAAVSNTAVAAETPTGAGKKAVTFADTIRMSTYLVAFVVGELEATDAVMVGKTPVRIWYVPGKASLAR